MKVSEMIAEQLNDTFNQRTWGDILYNVKVYGAVGDNTNDDTSAIQAAINAAKISGGIVYFPPGNYKCGTLSISGIGIILRGSGDTSRLFFTGTTTNCIEMRGCVHCAVEDLDIESYSTPPTAGSIISMDNCAWVYVNRVSMGYYSKIWTGISITSVVAGCQGIYIDKCNVYKHQGVGILLENATNVQVINDIFISNCWVQWLQHTGSDAPTVNTIGLKLNRTNGSLQVININNCEFIGAYWALYAIQPRLVRFTDSYFDSYTYIDGMTLSKFEGCWFSGGLGSNTPLTAHDYKNLISVKFAKCDYDPDSVSGAGGCTISVSGTCDEVVFDGNTIAGGCHRGISLAGGDNVRIINNYIANNPNIPNTQNITIGVDILAGFTGNVDISENNLTDMTTPINNNSGDKTKVFARLNRGYNPVKAITPPAFPASGGTYTNNTGVRLRVIVSGGSVVTIYINGTSTGLASGVFIIDPGEVMAFTYTTVPNWIFQGL